MKKKIILLFVVLFLGTSVANANYGASWGKAAMVGEIIESGCSIQLHTQNQVIDFGDLSLSDAEDNSVKKTFKIILKDCQLSNKNFNHNKSPMRIKFSGWLSNNTKGFKFNNHDGLSLVLLQNDNVIAPNEYYPVIDLHKQSDNNIKNEYQLNFVSELLVDSNAKPEVGEFSSIITFNIDYY